MREERGFQYHETIIALLLGGLLLAASIVPVASAQTALDCTAQGSIRVANTSPDAGAFDVVIGGLVVAPNVAFPNISAPIPMPVGTVRVQLYHAGRTSQLVLPMDIPVTAGSHVTVALLGPTPLTLTGGQIATVVVRGTVAGGTVGLTILPEAAGA
jgi:hypothetical protein